MASGIIVPLRDLPPEVSRIQRTLSEGFSDFGLPCPTVRLNSRLAIHERNPLNSFIFVEGQTPRAQCWISISRCSPELTEVPDCEYLAEVMTRTDWNFAAMIAYSLCKEAETIVLNDAHQFGNEDVYTSKALRNLIEARLK
jgi:hypothetical protein